MNKLTKTARNLDIFFKVLSGIAAALTAILIASLAALLIMALLSPNHALSALDSTALSLELGCVNLELNNAAVSAIPTSVLVAQNAGILLLALVLCVIIRFWIKCIRDILKPMIQGAPFHGTISKNLKKLALYQLIMGITFKCADFFNCIILTHGYHLPALLENGTISKVSINCDLNLSFLVVSAVFLLMSYIFRYGEELQQLSDETL